MTKCSQEVFYITALNADDILRDVDPGSSERSGGCVASLSRIEISSGTLDFIVRCAMSRNSWETRIQLYDWNYAIPEEDREVLDPNISWDQLKADYPELLGSELKLHCNCPAFLYWGSNYTLHQLDTALSPEDRYPGIRDPNLEKVACKHVISVLRTFFR